MFWVRFTLLLCTWLVLSGIFDAMHITLGVLASAAVAYSSRNLALQEGARPNFGMAFRLAGYTCWLLKEIVTANVQVFWLSVSPNPRQALTPRLKRFRTRVRGDFARFVFANSITLTPGTVTIRLDGDEYLVHALVADMAEALPGEMERRILNVFEPEAAS